MEALRLSDLWLDPTTSLPSGIRTATAWNRNEWNYHTLEVWKKLCDPVAARMVEAMNELVPEEAQAALGPMRSMMATLGGALFGGQLGQALGTLAGEVLSAGDIGLPLGPAGTAAWCRPTSPSTGPGWRWTSTSCGSTWRCGRRPTNVCSGTCPGCVGTC